MKAKIVIDISAPLPYLVKFWFSNYGSKCCQPIKLQYSFKCNISRKKWIIKLIFGIQINIEVFYKLLLSFDVSLMRHAQGIHNEKFSYLCNIFRKMWRMKLIFCLQINTKVFYKVIVSLWEHVARHAQSTQNSNFAISQGKHEGWSWIFVCR